jgi:ribonucleoside-triphosphate reductase
MAVRVIKRDGTKVKFNVKKINNAIKKASINEKIKISAKNIKRISKLTANEAIKSKKDIEIEKVQDIVVKNLKKEGFGELSNKYQDYRVKRTRQRDSKLKIMSDIHKIGVQTDRDNANVGNNFSAKLLRIASEANK